MCRQPGHWSSLDAKHLKLMALFCPFFVSPPVMLLGRLLLLLSIFLVCQQHLFQSNPTVAVLLVLPDPQIQSPRGLNCLWFHFDAQLHHGYALLVDIPPLEMCCWLIFQWQHSLKTNPKATATGGIFLDWCVQCPLSSPLPSRKRQSQSVAELNRRKSPHLRKEIWQKLDSE